MKRIWCYIFGCSLEQHEPCCFRCGTALYDADFRQSGIAPVEWYRSLRHKWRYRRWFRKHPCDVCGKTLYMTPRECCSAKCEEEWYPF